MLSELGIAALTWAGRDKVERDVAKAEPTNPFVGRWRITHMDEWDQDFVDAEVEGYIEFTADGSGEFQFGYVRGGMDCRLTTRDGQPCVEWTWDGNDEMDPAQGRGGAGRSSSMTNRTG